MSATFTLMLVLFAGLAAQSRPVAIAAGFLLLLNLTGFPALCALIARWGPSLGFALLAAAALAPLAAGPSPGGWSWPALLSAPALLAFAFGAAATYLAQRGLSYLQLSPVTLLALGLGLLGALLWQSPAWPRHLASLGRTGLPALGLSEGRVVGGMALMRLVSGLIEVGAALLMLRAGRIGSALQINATLGLIGPVVNLLVCAAGLVFVAVKFTPWRAGLALLGVILVWFGTR